MKVILAFLIAPLAPLVVIGPIVALGFGTLEAIGPYAAICIFYGYPAMLLFGLPLYIALRNKANLTWRHYAGIGAAVGAAIPAVILFSMLFLTGLGERPLELAASIFGAVSLGAALGGFSAFVFWGIALRSSNKALQPTGPASGGPGG